MKFFDDAWETFMSPQNGRILLQSLPDLTEDYIFVGDIANRPAPSPILIDVRLELIRLRATLSQTRFILQTEEEGFDASQALDELSPGILKQSGGIISIAIPGQDYMSADLTQGHLWIGDANNKAAEQQTITIDNLPPLNAISFSIGPVTYGIYQLWQGTNAGRPEASYSVSTFLAQVDYAFKTTNWIIGKSGVVPGALIYPGAQFIELLRENSILIHVSDGEIGVASLTYNHFWVGDQNNIPVEQSTLPIGSLPDLQFKHLWIGDATNRPQENLLILMDNLPDLTYKAIWRGNINNRPEETQDLTILEAKVTYIQNVTIPAIEAEIASIQAEIAAIQAQITVIEGEVSVLQAAVVILQGQVAGLIASVASLSNRVDTLETNVATLQAQVAVIQGQIIAINTRIDNLRLNTIPADGDVSFYNFKLINLADPVNPTDGVNLRTLLAAIEGAIGNITLTGFVLGTSDAAGNIATTRGPLCLLTNIPAGGDVSIDGYRLTNVGDYEADRDALTIEGFWDLIHLPNLYVARVNPEVLVLGSLQQFSFDAPRSVFEIANTFAPTALIPSRNIEEFRNSNLSGYRFVQESSILGNSGDFSLEKFEQAQEQGDRILSFIEASDNLQLEKILNANNKRIVNVPEEPQGDQDAISFLFLWRVLNDEVF